MLSLAFPVRTADQIGGDSVEKIGAGLIQKTVVPCGCQRVFDHIAGSGLAVCAGDDDDLHPAGDGGKDIPGNLQPDYARDRGSAPPGFTENKAGHFACCDRCSRMEFIGLFHIIPLKINCKLSSILYVLR